MAAFGREVKVEYLLSAVEAPLPSIDAVQRHFREHFNVNVGVETTQDGYLLTVKENFYLWYFSARLPLDPVTLTINDQTVNLDHLVPDIYGCEVFVGKDHVVVNVGPDVIQRITADEQWRSSFLRELTKYEYSCFPASLIVHYMRTGRIAVRCLLPISGITALCWKYFVIAILINLLRPYKASLPADSLPARDRRFTLQDRLLEHDWVPRDSEGCLTDAVVVVHKMQYAVIRSDIFLKKIRAKYPGVRIICDRPNLQLKSSGGSNEIEEAAGGITAYCRALTTEDISVTDAQARRMKHTNAERWFTEVLTNNDVECIWKRKHFETMERLKWTSWIRPKMSREIVEVISVFGSPSGIKNFKRILQYCFQTTHVSLNKNQVLHLQSDDWKRFVDAMEKPHEGEIPPALKVEKNKVSICDVASSIESTRRAVQNFLHRSVCEPNNEDCTHITEIITDLQPMQMKYLTKVQDKKQLAKCLQQEDVWVNSETDTVCIRAPLDRINKCKTAFFKWMLGVSQQTIALTAASRQGLQTSDSSDRVQSLLDREGVVCDWHVEQGQLVYSTHHSHLQQVREIFVKEIETTQHTAGTQIREEYSEQHRERSEIILADEQQQTDRRQCVSKEQQTHLQTEDKQVQVDIRADMEEVHTGEEKMQTCIRHQQNKTQETTGRKMPTEDTDLPKEIRPIEHQVQRTDESRVSSCGKRSGGFAAENSLPLEEGRTDTGGTPSLLTHQAEEGQVGRVWNLPSPAQTDIDQSQEAAQPARPRISPSEMVQPASCDVKEHGLDLQGEPQPSHLSTEDFRHGRDSEETTEEYTSVTLLKSVVRPQEERTEDAADIPRSVCDSDPCQHLFTVSEGQVEEDPHTTLGHSSPSQHLTQSSFPERPCTEQEGTGELVRPESHGSRAFCPALPADVGNIPVGCLHGAGGSLLGPSDHLVDAERQETNNFTTQPAFAITTPTAIRISDNERCNQLQLQLNSAHQQLSSANHARLTQLEASQMERRRELVMERWMVNMEALVGNVMEQRFDEMIQWLNNRGRRHSDSDSDVLSVGNPSAMLSESSGSSSMEARLGNLRLNNRGRRHSDSDSDVLSVGNPSAMLSESSGSSSME